MINILKAKENDTANNATKQEDEKKKKKKRYFIKIINYINQYQYQSISTKIIKFLVNI